jgi:hypothetical protein
MPTSGPDNELRCSAAWLSKLVALALTLGDGGTAWAAPTYGARLPPQSVTSGAAAPLAPALAIAAPPPSPALAPTAALAVTSPVQPFAGNTQIAYDFLHGNTHLMVIGDSLQGSLLGSYPSRWHIDHWSGYLGGPNYGTPLFGDSGIYTNQFQGSTSVIGPAGVFAADQAAPDSVNNVSPAATYHIVFNGATAGSNPFFPAALQNRLYDVVNTPTQHTNFWGGPWLDSATAGKIHMDVLTYANPNGIAPGNVQVNAFIDSASNVIASAPISTRSATSGWQKTTLTYDATAWTPGTGLTLSFQAIAGAVPPGGSNLVIGGVRFYTDQPGFQMVNMAQAARTIDYFTNPNICSDQALSNYINLTDSNMLYVWIGQNGSTTVQPAQFMTQMQTLIARYKAAKPDMRFVLVSSYDTGSPYLAGYADDLYQIAQSDPSVFFMNVYGTAGPYPYLDSHYLSDHVHETAAGAQYIADLTNDILEQAAAQYASGAGIAGAAAVGVPEPAALMSGAVVALGMLRRRRRRRVSTQGGCVGSWSRATHAT